MTPVFDLSFLQHDPPTAHMATGKPRFKIRGGNVVRRDPSTITGITTHQMNCSYGVTSRQIKAAEKIMRQYPDRNIGTDPRDAARHLRTLNSSASCYFALSCGHVVKTFDPSWYCYSSNGLSATTVSVEHEGKYPGLSDGKTIPSSQVVEAGEAAILLAMRDNPNIHLVYAHRQSSKDRRGDPGESIWKLIVLPCAADFDLLTDCGYHVGSGRPVCREWDVCGEGKY